jgi:hypothetical protein
MAIGAASLEKRNLLVSISPRADNRLAAIHIAHPALVGKRDGAQAIRR